MTVSRWQARAKYATLFVIGHKSERERDSKRDKERGGQCVATLVALLMWLMLTLKGAQHQTERQTDSP